MNILSGSLSGSSALLVGFGKTGAALAKWLIKEGVSVSVTDKRKSEKEILKEAEKSGCKDVKYVKDSSVDDNNDSLQFKVIFRS